MKYITLIMKYLFYIFLFFQTGQKNIADICVITRNFFECFETKGKEVNSKYIRI